MRRLLLLICLLSPAWAEDLARQAQEAQQRGQWLRTFTLLQRAAAESDAPRPLYSQLAQLAPFLGEARLAREYEDLGARDKRPELKPLPPSNPLEGRKQLPALDAIAAAARDRQIVILNEKHDSSQSRVFGTQLMQRLQAEGFKLFAAETFSTSVYAYHEFHEPLADLGYYTQDPFFGDLARQAMALGMRLFNYEARSTSSAGDMWDSINRREVGQAANLKRNLLDRYPGQKVFLYVGYAHATEDWTRTPDGREIAWMAARLQRLTGIDPLTIDQTDMVEHSAPEYEREAYRFAHVEEPTIFEGYTGGAFANKVDLQVFHPRTRYVNGRPDWARLGSYRHDVAVRSEWLPTEGSWLLEAFLTRETIQPLPMDRVVVTAGKPAPCLLLPPGTYRLTAQDEEGKSRVLQEELVISML